MSKSTGRPPLTSRHVDTFKLYYAKRLRTAARRNSWKEFDHLAKMIVGTVRNGNRVFAFGNGGSCAMATTFLLELKESLPPKLARLIAAPLQLHDALRLAHKHGFDYVFAESLSAEAGKDDLIVFVSSSSASLNIRHGIDRARQLRLQSVLVTNTPPVNLRHNADLLACIELDDQQPGEDLALVALRSVVQVVRDALTDAGRSGRSIAPLTRMIRDVVLSIGKFVVALRSETVHEIAKQIVEAYSTGHRVFVYAPSGGPLSIVAQHVAHNLQWDALMSVDVPGNPRMQIQVSSIGNIAHLTGVSNDRDFTLFHARQLMFEGRAQDVVIWLTPELTSQTSVALRAAVARSGMTFFAFTPEWCAQLDGGGTDRQYHLTPWTFETAAQVFGHLLGRTVRAYLVAEGRGRGAHPDYDQLLRRELKEIVNKVPGTDELREQLVLGPAHGGE